MSSAESPADLPGRKRDKLKKVFHRGGSNHGSETSESERDSSGSNQSEQDQGSQRRHPVARFFKKGGPQYREFSLKGRPVKKWVGKHVVPPVVKIRMMDEQRLDQFFNLKYMDDVLADPNFFATGDILLCRGTERFSKIIRLGTACTFSHISMIVVRPSKRIREAYKVPDDCTEEVFIYESDTETYDEREGGGVQMVPFRVWMEGLVEEYGNDCLVCTRRLFVLPKPRMEADLVSPLVNLHCGDGAPSSSGAHTTEKEGSSGGAGDASPHANVHSPVPNEKKVDVNLDECTRFEPNESYEDWLEDVAFVMYNFTRKQLIFSAFGANKTYDGESLFCSELVASTYQQMGVLPKDKTKKGLRHLVPRRKRKKEKEEEKKTDLLPNNFVPRDFTSHQRVGGAMRLLGRYWLAPETRIRVHPFNDTAEKSVTAAAELEDIEADVVGTGATRCRGVNHETADD
eukprot:TRINITY_DN5839_c0_g1_i1.p1 TRINITY_DN5839_c0_g1~~TRINITY_DN5839_c0_g1_i1.p1  ORF type:complete len:458 (+),score=87.13 TRINITY_DN5839_c0_g1_i1:167-1540(+)